MKMKQTQTREKKDWNCGNCVFWYDGVCKADPPSVVLTSGFGNFFTGYLVKKVGGLKPVPKIFCHRLEFEESEDDKED